MHGHVEDRFYLAQEPLVRSVPTHMLGDPEEHQQAICRLHELAVKPRHGHGGKGVVIGAHADREDLDRLAEDVELLPGGLTLVAFDPGSLVVNSSQNGGGKDTWVID